MRTKEIIYYLEMTAVSQLRPSQIAISDVGMEQAAIPCSGIQPFLLHGGRGRLVLGGSPAVDL